jgi:hypothetical protein
VQVATLDPFHGYKNAIDDQLEDAVAVLDAFHVVKLGTQAVDEIPGDPKAWEDPQAVERSVPGLLRHRPRQQRRHRGH